ncbi:MAG: GxxExxY protein [Cyclobacteriaceae bacterium]
MKTFKPLSEKEVELGKQIVNASSKVHQELGPGLLEKVYETWLTHELRKQDLIVQRQLTIPIVYDGIAFNEGSRLDILRISSYAR